MADLIEMAPPTLREKARVALGDRNLVLIGLMDAIAQDKKVKGGKLTFILTRGIGQSFLADDVPASEVLSFLREKHPQ